LLRPKSTGSKWPNSCARTRKEEPGDGELRRGEKRRSRSSREDFRKRRRNQVSDARRRLRRNTRGCKQSCGLIAGYIHHPNVAGATVLSLGCQNSQVSILREELKKRDRGFSKPLFVFEQQQSGSEFAMLSAAIKRLSWTGRGQQVRTQARTAFSPFRWPEMWRFRRIFGHLSKSGDRSYFRSSRRSWRPDHPF